jgi:hypothetical protein
MNEQEIRRNTRAGIIDAFGDTPKVGAKGAAIYAIRVRPVIYRLLIP